MPPSAEIATGVSPSNIAHPPPTGGPSVPRETSAKLPSAFRV